MSAALQNPVRSQYLILFQQSFCPLGVSINSVNPIARALRRVSRHIPHITELSNKIKQGKESKKQKTKNGEEAGTYMQNINHSLQLFDPRRDIIAL